MARGSHRIDAGRRTPDARNGGRRLARPIGRRRSWRLASGVRRPGAKRPGFTLVEAICAVAILGIGAAGGAAAWSACSEMNRAARAMQAETNIIEQELERVRRLNWGGLADAGDWVEHMAYDAEGNPLGPASRARPSGHGYITSLKVEPLSEETLCLKKKWRLEWVAKPALRRVTLRVRAYPLDDKKLPAVETATYLASEGL